MEKNTQEPRPPGLIIALPDGINAAAVAVRKAALIAAGTDPLIAERLAIDAEAQQALSDARTREGSL